MRGFASIGLVRPKHPENVGHIMRAAYVYQATLKDMREAGVDRYDIRLCLPVLRRFKEKADAALAKATPVLEREGV
jgi:tRNA(Leu) C34 or U34 (ribose-2'-O)-methylase TrmL